MSHIFLRYCSFMKLKVVYISSLKVSPSYAQKSCNLVNGRNEQIPSSYTQKSCNLVNGRNEQIPSSK